MGTFPAPLCLSNVNAPTQQVSSPEPHQGRGQRCTLSAGSGMGDRHPVVTTISPARALGPPESGDLLVCLVRVGLRWAPGEKVTLSHPAPYLPRKKAFSEASTGHTRHTWGPFTQNDCCVSSHPASQWAPPSCCSGRWLLPAGGHRPGVPAVCSRFAHCTPAAKSPRAQCGSAPPRRSWGPAAQEHSLPPPVCHFQMLARLFVCQLPPSDRAPMTMNHPALGCLLHRTTLCVSRRKMLCP